MPMTAAQNALGDGAGVGRWLGPAAAGFDLGGSRPVKG